ncbi:MAG: hypothetical protein ACLGHL_07310 [Actinomycetota bacterium]
MRAPRNARVRVRGWIVGPGLGVGDVEGEPDGSAVGDVDAVGEGSADGLPLGEVVALGDEVGDEVGEEEGLELGVGDVLGEAAGDTTIVPLPLGPLGLLSE